MITILGIKITDRIKEAGLTQKVLTEHGPVIATRLGFHEVTDDVCSREAFIILHLGGEKEARAGLIKELESLGGIELSVVTFPLDDAEPVKKEKRAAGILCLLVERDPGTVISVQKVLTAYGCNIRTRLGVNELFFGEPAGLLILELKGDAHQRELLERDLNALGRVHVNPLYI